MVNPLISNSTLFDLNGSTNNTKAKKTRKLINVEIIVTNNISLVTLFSNCLSSLFLATVRIPYLVTPSIPISENQFTTLMAQLQRPYISAYNARVTKGNVIRGKSSDEPVNNKFITKLNLIDLIFTDTDISSLLKPKFPMTILQIIYFQFTVA